MMPETLSLGLGLYISAVSLLALVLTAYDKHAARIGARRVRERTLLLVSALGGSMAMLAAMWAIRHKTKHTKFMAGIPAIILVQAAGGLCLWLLKGGT